MKRFFLPILKWAFAVTLLVGIIWFYHEKLLDAYHRRKEIDVTQLVWSAGFFLAGMSIVTIRWWVLVRGQDLPFHLYDAFRLSFISLFFSQILPGGVGGDVVKAGFLASMQERRTVAISTILIDRLIGLYGMFVLAGVCGVFYFREPWLAHPTLQLVCLVSAGVTLAGILGLFVLPLLPMQGDRILIFLHRWGRVGAILAEVVRALRLYKRHPLLLGSAIAIGLIGQAGFMTSFHLSAHAFPYSMPSLEQHFFCVPAMSVFQSLPIFPGGLGGGEIACENLYTWFDASFAGQGVLAVWANRLVVYACALPGLLAYFPIRRFIMKYVSINDALRVAHAMAVALYFGTMLFFTFFVALPVLAGIRAFARDPENWAGISAENGTRLAGEFLNIVFATYFPVQVVCGAVALLTALAWWGFGRTHTVRIAILAAALGLSSLNCFSLAPIVHELRNQRYSSDEVTAEKARASFQTWHDRSLLADLATLLLVTVAVGMVPFTPTKFGGPSALTETTPLPNSATNHHSAPNGSPGPPSIKSEVLGS